MRALVDLDVVIYAAGFAAQHKRYIGYSGDHPVVDFKIKQSGKPRIYKALDSTGATLAKTSKRPEIFTELGLEDYEEYNQVEDVAAAIHGFKSMVQNIVNASKADSSKLFLTGSGNFREEVATLLKYKGNREDTPKPEHYKALREYAIDHLGAELIEGMEADDALAIEQQADINGTIICTIDKDLNQVHGMKFNWTKRDKPSGDTSECFNYIEKEEGMILFFTQLITGDATDNIGGLKGTRGKPGPGMRGAAKAYKDCKKVSEYYEAALEMYKKKYGDTLTYTSWKGTELTKTTEEVMLENASLLWMKRTKDEGELNLSLMEKYYE